MRAKIWMRKKYKALTHHQKIATVLCFAGIVLFLSVLLFKGCQVLASHQNKSPVPPMMVRHGDDIEIPVHSPLRAQIQISTAHLSDRPHEVSFPGFVEADPRLTVDIRPPLTGRLITLPIKLGEMVKKGQVVAVISSPEMAQASTDFAKAQSALDYAKQVMARVKRVHQIGGNATKDVQQAAIDYTQAQADVQRAQARLKTLGHNRYSLLSIKAPIPGRITALNYGIGSYINDTAAVLMTISDLSRVWVTANVPENLAGVVAEHQRVKILMPAYPKQILYGQISFVNSFLDVDTRSNRTRIAFDNPLEKLQTNMFATVKIALTQPNLILIPASAVLMNDDTTSVYVEKKPWVFERRAVKLGPEDGGQIRVIAGLKANERVVTAGGVFIND